jgi:nucleoside recognition membrane protein YjiH
VRRWFSATPAWVALRVVGGVFAAAVYFGVGRELLRAPDTGGTVFHDICLAVMLVYIAGTFLMGLLTDYGLMEFAGTLARRPFEVLFRLPGRSVVDALASFVAASGLGVLLTIRQYEMRRYTAREACVIVSSFSIVSIPFSLVIASVAGIDHLFFSWYLTLVVACIAAAMVVARIGPMARKSEALHGGGEGPVADEADTAEGPALRRALAGAEARAARAEGAAGYLRSAALQCGDLLFGVLGPIMATATVASILVFHTPVFDVLARPIGWGLGAFGFPEAAGAAKGFVVGLLDQFMPALVAAGLESEFARFVLAGLSVTQLIYFSEVALLQLRSPLPVTVMDLIVTFFLRTVVVTPFIIAGAAILV